ncbi:MAG: mechanosensitive ion channel [Sphingopyxis sp.]|uniref:mechanosensitive ion channel family protein n=1 Tax=Sphingopyxis sp. TaxID=1908224 RepID=UPI002AB8F2B2|nr:mechanosensitive ion channel domain-containing protein [Sphingopyxis sp.]MDZ3833312.1 mechanosensitive ion channel [Sphingopyxis sp.]
MKEIEAALHYLDPSRPVGAVAIAALLLLVGLLLSRLVRGLIVEALRHDRSERIDQISLSFLSHLTILIIWLLLATLYAHLIPALNRLATAMLAGVGLVSVIVGFAAQTTLGNLVAGISLVLYKPFRRGDRLQVAAPTKDEFEVGEVEDISLGYTMLRTDDGRQIVIANGTMAQQTFIKLTRG